jgi:hypothetical protein
MKQAGEERSALPRSRRFRHRLTSVESVVPYGRISRYQLTREFQVSDEARLRGLFVRRHSICKMLILSIRIELKPVCLFRLRVITFLYDININHSASFSNTVDAPSRTMRPTRMASSILASSAPASRAFTRWCRSQYEQLAAIEAPIAINSVNFASIVSSSEHELAHLTVWLSGERGGAGSRRGVVQPGQRV